MQAFNSFAEVSINEERSDKCRSVHSAPALHPQEPTKVSHGPLGGAGRALCPSRPCGDASPIYPKSPADAGVISKAAEGQAKADNTEITVVPKPTACR